MKIISEGKVEELKPKNKVNVRDVNVNVVSAENKRHPNAHKRKENHQRMLKKRQDKELKKRQAKHKKNSEKFGDKKDKIQNPKAKVLENTEPSFIQQHIDQFTSLIRFNITFKLTLGFAFRLVLMLSIIVILIYASFSYFLFYSAERDLTNQVVLIDDIVNSNTEDVPVYEQAFFNAYMTQNNLFYYVYDQNESIITTNHPETMPLMSSFLEPSTFDASNLPNLPEPFVKFTSSELGNDALKIGETMVIEKDMSFSTAIIEATFPVVIVFTIVLFLTYLRAVSRMAHRHLKPIHAMTEEVKDMSLKSLSTRLNVSGTKDELKDLAMTFNQMLDDIEKSYEREKQFVSDASHELRTPIAVIKGYAGMLNRWGKEDPEILEESIDAILGETENMHSLVESLLFIARNDKGTLKMDLETFSLSELLCEIVKETKLIDQTHDIEDRITPDLKQFGSTDKLKQAFRIFIDNSIKYTPDGGKINILLNATSTHNQLIISDNGIGISKEDLPNIFDRFYRADKSRTKLKAAQHGGTGLGLSIAKIIIEQHGGNINVESDLNQGTTFTLIFPKTGKIARE